MAGGLIGLIPGVSKASEAMSKFANRGVDSKSSSASKTSATPTPSVGILDSAATSPAQYGWSSSKGVNGTTSPKGVGKWGVGA